MLHSDLIWGLYVDWDWTKFLNLIFALKLFNSTEPASERRNSESWGSGYGSWLSLKAGGSASIDSFILWKWAEGGSFSFKDMMPDLLHKYRNVWYPQKLLNKSYNSETIFNHQKAKIKK